MQSELYILLITAITIACLHTVSGPDHYVPFIALSRARGWTFRRTIFWTVVCGCGHVWSSVFLGLIGAAIGWSVARLGWLESVRGGIAGWTLLGFGLIYCIWGIIRAGQDRRHKHFDTDGSELYVYEHRHGAAIAPKERHKLTPWVMFLIFLLGPCEPMIPLLYFPAVKNSTVGMALLVITYTAVTLLTMIAMVALGYYGVSFFKSDKMEKYIHAFGGATIFICGAGMVFLEW